MIRSKAESPVCSDQYVPILRLNIVFMSFIRKMSDDCDEYPQHDDDDLCFTSLSTLFSSYQDDEGSVQ